MPMMKYAGKLQLTKSAFSSSCYMKGVVISRVEENCHVPGIHKGLSIYLERTQLMVDSCMYFKGLFQ